MATRPRILIVDKRAVMGTEVCRQVAAQGCVADVFAADGSPAFRSRFCSGRLVAPPFEDADAFRAALGELVAAHSYAAIHVCHEEIVGWIMPRAERPEWRGFLHPPIDRLKAALSKNAMLSVAEQAGVAVPRTVIPRDESELEQVAKDFSLPLVIKGDTGESGETVRIVWEARALAAKYREVRARETRSDARPAVQEFVRGPAYSVGGLCQKGRALRLIAHRKLVRYPYPWGGRTVRGVTEDRPDVNREAFKIFEALDYTGLGHVEFIRDERDNRLKFLEVNPRLWGTVGVAQAAGVDLFTPYRDLVAGTPVKPDLRFATGVVFHRMLREVRLMHERPQRVFGFIRDVIDPRVRSDFMWSDPGPHLLSREILRRLGGRSLRGAESGEREETPSVLPRESS